MNAWQRQFVITVPVAHKIHAMSEIVRELSLLGWSEEKISKELGMDDDEVLRLKQINGLQELFADRRFSKAWTVK